MNDLGKDPKYSKNHSDEERISSGWRQKRSRNKLDSPKVTKPKKVGTLRIKF